MLCAPRFGYGSDPCGGHHACQCPRSQRHERDQRGSGRERAERASRKESETHILYDLVRTTNRETEPGHQLHTIAQKIVEVLSSWGVQDCAILQPDVAGTLQVQASAYQTAEQITLSTDEKTSADWVHVHFLLQSSG